MVFIWMLVNVNWCEHLRFLLTMTFWSRFKDTTFVKRPCWAPCYFMVQRWNKPDRRDLTRDSECLKLRSQDAFILLRVSYDILEYNTYSAGLLQLITNHCVTLTAFSDRNHRKLKVDRHSVAPGECTIPRKICPKGQSHTWNIHPQSSTAVTHCLLIATPTHERMIACVKLESATGSWTRAVGVRGECATATCSHPRWPCNEKSSCACTFRHLGFCCQHSSASRGHPVELQDLIKFILRIVPCLQLNNHAWPTRTGLAYHG